ncbi:conserved hypothetical protein [Methanothermus fervidus DSM 2088]|uniref:PD-(D/E)XK endonuclease-like domain-containing protein n=1 Tax=Methanothermus fervidus (strain ATCC 43054 / DSM 2088 / JCM 10308 / V24 S) TaxID=523846 RepID=E3GZK9_METFV|nr:hypothetical protein [Methanothermus fervidus]ADP77741.1 conserved hypothetical protein [Methanothermus fervidus DSM 2088]
MSLTSFIKIKDVRQAFKREFKKPRLKVQRKLLAPPLTNHYGLVGMAFDYLLRFYIKRLNPDAVEHPWVSEVSLQLLERLQLLSMFTKDEIFSDDVDTIINPELLDPYVYDKVEEIIEYSKKVYNEFIKTGKMNSDLYRAALLLAQVDLIYRAGVVDKNLGSVDKNDIKDLKNLISIVKPEYFKAKKICVLNPTFGEASQLVGGADCDIVIDDTIIDIKTTKNLELRRDYFNQLIGYYILYKIGGIDGMPSNYKIKRLGIYFSRHAYLHVFDVKDIIKKDSFPNFVEWFKKRANEEYAHKL